jgi:tyrosyl-tRNA synthetase
MGQNAYQLLRDRGFIYQTTSDDTVLEALFAKEAVTAYIGFDVTADSLHVGHLLPLIVLSWLDRLGHRSVALVGGGTSMIGDPSGRTQARQLMTLETIRANQESVRPQMARFVTLAPEGRSLVLNNADWLADLNYLAFMRDIGQHFSVNRMLAAECYKSRLEEGLSFLEFNYMLIQAFDFLTLFSRHGCQLQLGGQDQWGNIVAGIDLIRRVSQGEAHGITMPLLIDPRTGVKFGKTNDGAVWLSEKRTPVYDFYQFWRNIDDQEAGRLLSLFTFLPLEECRSLARSPGNLINRAKEILAYEVTALIHGPEAAAEAFLASVRAFGAADPEGAVATTSSIRDLTESRLSANLPAVDVPREEAAALDLAQLFVRSALAASKGEARRLIRQGGAYADNTVIPADQENSPVRDLPWFSREQVTLRAGKKRYKIVRFG